MILWANKRPFPNTKIMLLLSFFAASPLMEPELRAWWRQKESSSFWPQIRCKELKIKKKGGGGQEYRRTAFSKHWDVACLCELVHSVRLNPVIIQRAPTGQAGTSKSITNSYSFTFGEKSILLYSLKSSIFFHFCLAWILSDSKVVWISAL